MFKTIEGAADCEIRSVVRFLNARNVLPSEIHHQNCQVYGDNAMSDGMVRKWVRMFNEERYAHTYIYIYIHVTLYIIYTISLKRTKSTPRTWGVVETREVRYGNTSTTIIIRIIT